MSVTRGRLTAWWRAHRGWRAAAILAVATAVVIVSWYPTPAPRTGFDPSWQIGLHLAASGGLQFGQDLAFPYGPLGFLLFPQTVGAGTWSLAFVATLLFRVATVALIIGAVRRALGHLLPAVLFGLIVAGLIGPLVTLPGVLAVGVALVVVQTPVRWAPALWVAPAGLGAFAALCLLIKLDAGLSALIALALAAWFQGRGRWVAAGQFAGGYVAAFVAGWLATGNDLGDIPRWMRWSWSVVAGYSGGASIADRQFAAGWHLPVALGTAALLVAAALTVWAPRPLGVRFALVAILGVGLWVEIKHGFVRHDTHVLGTFFAIGVFALAVRWTTNRMVFIGAALAGVGLVSGFVVLDAALDADRIASPRVTGPSLVRLVPVGADDFWREARLLGDGARRDRVIAERRAAVRSELGIAPALVTRIGSAPVHVAPSEISAVWAEGLNWRPAPQFQAFSTWTPLLDDLNAAALRGPDGPRFVLRLDTARFDQHSPLWESPAENLAYVCDFRRRLVAGDWELRERVATRCGPERPLGVVGPAADGTVAIPAARPGELVIARISIHPGLWSRARAFAYRPSAIPGIVLVGLRREPFAVPAALLGQPLIVRAPSQLDWPVRMARLTRATKLRLVNMPGARVRFVARAVR